MERRESSVRESNLHLFYLHSRTALDNLPQMLSAILHYSGLFRPGIELPTNEYGCDHSKYARLLNTQPFIYRILHTQIFTD